MLPATASRVENATSADLNRRFAAEIEESLRHHAEHPEEIERRLDELDHEWDIERMLEANAATLALTGTVLGALVDRRFLVLPAVVTGFLLQHALQGWCPPVPVFRRLGVRTTAEIDRERYALKALRGDFRRLDTTSLNTNPRRRAEAALDAAVA
ncbi:DUF2892 domain-containing protein [Azospirillum halopraeferens]|uniref:DUF2892 domain-containing protein n=1 Tax=Azospirillum halopraeferens TaxID=34010 RepID=UPI0003FA0BDC|nr:DUF2892 domain-containing protein [Azospirillum halopraeferens]